MTTTLTKQEKKEYIRNLLKLVRDITHEQNEAIKRDKMSVFGLLVLEQFLEMLYAWDTDNLLKEILKEEKRKND